VTTKTEVIIAKKDPIKLIFSMSETKTNHLHVPLPVTEAVLFFISNISRTRCSKNCTNSGDEEESPTKVHEKCRRKVSIRFIERVMARYIM